MDVCTVLITNIKKQVLSKLWNQKSLYERFDYILISTQLKVMQYL